MDRRLIAMGFLFPAAFAIGCALIAERKGRSVVGWFFLGLIFQLLALILLLVVGEAGDVPRADVDARRRARRLEEELRIERQRRETLEREVVDTKRRIDMHDQALGIETRRLDPAPPLDARYLGLGDQGWRSGEGLA